tara:strand:- start:436 stop:897 length:462 start_codon:yes stop_codon:yes gene_type:complete
MARRKSKQKRRSTPKTTNVLKVAEAIVVGSAATKMFFGTNLFEFTTGRLNGNTMSESSGSQFNTTQITLPELVGFGKGVEGEQGGTQYSKYGGLYGNQTIGGVVQDNVKEFGLSSITTMVVAPIAFRFGGRLAAPIRRQFNSLAKQARLPLRM